MTARVQASFACAELGATPQAARQARALVRDTLGGDHPLAPDATLAVTELVSNSLAHGRSGQPGGTIGIAVATQPGAVLIQVRDAGGPGAPVLRRDRDSEHGRGLQLIDAIAAEWGTRSSGTGRLTWCRLTPSPARTPETRVPEREAG
jgi:anti-sigma regulatory factor (Ser/Thr protein kinase)